MDSEQARRLKIQAVVIGYAMSRLDSSYLAARTCSTWKDAFAEASEILSEAAASIKNLRDEFDPFHGNSRKGWGHRAMRPDRQRVWDELQEVSDEALTELVTRILLRDDEATEQAIDSLAVKNKVAHNVAERLLTGRRAEEFFLANCHQLARVDVDDLLDFRQSARGFDFGVKERPQQAIEIKGIKQSRGTILFTDREWTEASLRRADYWLIVVGRLATEIPVARLIQDPHAYLTKAKCLYQTTITASWQTPVEVE